MKSPLFTSLSFFTLFLLITSIPSYSQSGCTDSLANNVTPGATINDGSCKYNITTYTPPVKVSAISNIMIESSGLQWADSSLWSFSDGGGAAAIYRIDTLSNALLQTVQLAGATNIDWEDIAFDGTYFYVGDFGNNANGARTDLKIYKFPLSAISPYSSKPVDTIPASQIDVISFKYSNQQTPVATRANNTKYDCEAMIVDSGKIHLFSKNWIDLNSTHYVISSTLAGSYTADSIETLQTNYLVTAADKAPGQNMIVLLGYQTTGFGNHFIHILSDYNGGRYFNGNKRRINLPNASQMGQAEGITFRNTRYGYISNERLRVGPFTVHQKLRSFDISPFVSASAGTILP